MSTSSSPLDAQASGDSGGRKQDRERLFEIIYENSFGRGEVRLASGRTSDFYFDMKPSMLHPEGALLIAKLFLDEVLAVRADFVGGLEMGAVPITGAVSLYSHQQGKDVYGVFVRKAVKDHGARKKIEGIPRSGSIAGKRVAIVEDVTTTGESALNAVDACREAGAEVVAVISIVDRGEGATETFAKHGMPFRSLFKAAEFLSR